MSDTKSFYSKVMKDMSIHNQRVMGLQVRFTYEASAPINQKKSGPIAKLVPGLIYEYGIAITPW